MLYDLSSVGYVKIVESCAAQINEIQTDGRCVCLSRFKWNLDAEDNISVQPF